MDKVMDKLTAEHEAAKAHKQFVEDTYKELLRERWAIAEKIRLYSAAGARNMGEPGGRAYLGMNPSDTVGWQLAEKQDAVLHNLELIQNDRQDALRAVNAAERALGRYRTAVRRQAKLPAMLAANAERQADKDRRQREKQERQDAIRAELGLGSLGDRFVRTLRGARS